MAAIPLAPAEFHLALRRAYEQVVVADSRRTISALRLLTRTLADELDRIVEGVPSR